MNWLCKRITAIFLLAALVLGLVSNVPFPGAYAATSEDAGETQTEEVTNLAPNPGFEELDDNGEPVGWTKWGTKAHTMVDGNETPDDVFSGRYALKVTDDSNTASVGVQSDTFPIEPGVSYRLSVYAMEQTAGDAFQVYIYYGHFETEDGAEKFVRDTAMYINTTGTGEWNYCEVTGIAPGVSTHARILLVSGGSSVGATCYDQVSFTKVGLADYVPVSFDGEWELICDGYPRMDFDPAGLEEIKAFSQSTDISAYGYSGTQALESLLAEADRYLAETELTLQYQNVTITFPLSPVLEDPTCREEFKTSPTGYAHGYPYMTTYGSNIFRRVQALALAYALTGEASYGARVKQYVLDMCAWQYWVGYEETYVAAKEQSSQGSGYAVDCLAAALDMCHDLFTAEELTLMEQQMIEKGLEGMYADAMPRMLRGQDMEQGTGLILGACAILSEDNIDQMKKYLDMGMTYINWRLDQFLNSGINEGNMYDSLGIDDIIVAMYTLKRVTGYEGPFSHPYMQEMEKRVLGFFEMTNGVLPAYSDSEFKTYYRHAMAVLSQQGNELASYYLATGDALSIPYDKLVWHSDKSLAELEIPDDRIGGVTYLGSHGQGALRTGWGTLDSLLTINANDSQMEHNHYDQNSILLAFNGKWMLTDSEYKDNAYTTLTAWELKYTNSTIFVDGKPQISRGKGSLSQVFNTHVYGYMIGSAPGAYGLEDKQPVLDKFDRHVIMLNHDSQPYYIVIDDLASQKERSFGWNFYTNGKLKLNDEAYTGYWDQVEMDGQVVANGTSATGNRLTLFNQGCTLHSYFVGAQVTTKEQSYLTHGPTLLVENSTPSKTYQFMNILSMEKDTATQYTTKFATYLGQADVISLTKPDSTAFFGGNVAGQEMVLFQIDSTGSHNGASIKLPFEVPEDGEYYITVDVGQTLTNHSYWNIYVDGLDADGDGSADYLIRGASARGPEGVYVIDCGKHYLTAGQQTLRVQISGSSNVDVTLPISAINLRKAGATMGEGTVKVTESYDEGDLLGATISYGTTLKDIVLFNRGTGTIAGGNLATNGQQASVLGLNGADISEGYAVTNGTSLKYGELVLMTADSPVSVAVDFTMAKQPVKNGDAEPAIHKDFNELDPVVYISAKAASAANVSLYLGQDVAYTAYVDGVATASTYENGVLTMVVPAGEHQITVTGAHFHEWEAADCITPKTCKLCGETEGEALGHTWIDATCTESKHCQTCGMLEGGPEHVGIEGQECFLCGKTFGYCNDNITWTLENGVLTLSGYGEMPEYTSNSYPWYSMRTSVKQIVVGDGITSIGNNAFYGCSAVTSVEIGDDVTTIGNSAFRGCTGLTEVTLGAGVTTIVDRAFYGCTQLAEIALPAGLTTVGGYAFYNCKALQRVVYCGTEEQWTKITVGNQNTYLQNAARSIHDWVEATCDAPKHCTVCGLTEGDVVHSWVDATCDAPKICSSCGKTEGAPAHKVVDEICTVCGLFGTCGENLTWALDADGTLTISGTGAMADYTAAAGTNPAPWYELRDSIKKLVVCEGVTTIGKYAMLNCRNMTDVVLADSVTTLRYASFHQCSGFTTFTFGKGVTTVEQHVFAGCSKLAVVNIFPSLVSIDSHAFRYCSKITAVNFCGTAQQWESANISTDDNDGLLNAPLNYHAWTSGDCTTPKTCTVCGLVEGSAPGHSYNTVTIAPTCVDAGFTTHTCTACGHSYTDNEVAALGHSAEAAVKENVVDATCVAAGSYDNVVYCAVCDAELSRETVAAEATGEHDYVDGTCSVCGATLTPTDASLVFVGAPGLSFQDYIGMQIMLRNKTVTNLGYTSFYVEITQVDFEGNATTTQTTGAPYGSFTFFEQQILSWSMTEQVTMTLYGVKDGVAYKGQSFTTSVEALALEKIPSYVESGDMARAKALVDMLNFGAAVQTAYVHNETDLPNADLGDLAQYGTTGDPEFTAVNDITGKNTITVYSNNISMQSKVEFQFMVKTTALEGMTVVAKMGDADATVAYEAMGSFTIIRVACGAAYMRDTFTIVVNDANGNAVTCTYNVTVEGYASQQLTGEKAPAMLALIRYGDSVAAIG